MAARPVFFRFVSESISIVRCNQYGHMADSRSFADEENGFSALAALTLGAAATSAQAQDLSYYAGLGWAP